MQYIDYLQNGGDINTVQQAVSYRSIANTQIDDNTDEDTLIMLNTELLKRKGITDENDIKDMIDSYRDRGLLESKAKESIQLHDELDKKLIEQERQAVINRNKEIEQQQAKQKAEYNKIIDKGVANGLKLKDKQKIKSAIFTPTEIVEYVDNSGKKVTNKIPLYNKLLEEFKQNPEQQIAFVELLLNGFDLTSIKNQAKRESNNDLFNALSGNANNKKDNIVKNAWIN